MWREKENICFTEWIELKISVEELRLRYLPNENILKILSILYNLKSIL